MATISQEVNIDILEKLRNGTFKKKNPSTVSGQVKTDTIEVPSSARTFDIPASNNAFILCRPDNNLKITLPSIPSGESLKVTLFIGLLSSSITFPANLTFLDDLPAGGESSSSMVNIYGINVGTATIWAATVSSKIEDWA